MGEDGWIVRRLGPGRIVIELTVDGEIVPNLSCSLVPNQGESQEDFEARSRSLCETWNRDRDGMPGVKPGDASKVMSEIGDALRTFTDEDEEPAFEDLEAEAEDADRRENPLDTEPARLEMRSRPISTSSSTRTRPAIRERLIQ